MKTLNPKTKDAVIQIAQWQVGVMESPANSNKVKYNTWFYGREVSGDPYKWCLVFVVWCFHHVGFNLRKTASCTELTNAYKEADQWVTSGFKPGDIVMYDFSGRKKITEHCGIVVDVVDGYVIAVEGNTGASSNTNGGAVMQRKRDLKFVTGACRPLYNK